MTRSELDDWSRRPGSLRRGADQAREQVDVVVAVHALHDRGDALEPHAGVYRWLGQRCQRAVGAAVELHEHEVPDLDESVALLVWRARRPAGDARAMVVKDLRARTARSGLAHRPEVRLRAHAGEALALDADLLQPYIGGAVVVLEHRDPQPFRRKTQRVGHELPGEADGLALEVVAEAEVAEHLEERVMTRRVAHVLEVVVLAACAHAPLRARRAHVVALVLPEKNILELHHPGVGEEQRRVVARHERARRHDGVAVLAEELEEGGA